MPAEDVVAPFEAGDGLAHAAGGGGGAMLAEGEGEDEVGLGVTQDLNEFLSHLYNRSSSTTNTTTAQATGEGRGRAGGWDAFNAEAGGYEEEAEEGEGVPNSSFRDDLPGSSTVSKSELSTTIPWGEEDDYGERGGRGTGCARGDGRTRDERAAARLAGERVFDERTIIRMPEMSLLPPPTTNPP